MTLDFTRIGQIGLGYMGSALAKRLQDLGKTAVGHDIDGAKMAALAEAGVVCRDSAAAVTREVDVVVVCVTSTDCVEQAVFGPGGVAEACTSGKVLIDISTTVAEATRDMAARLKEQTGMDWIDAPVSGGPCGGGKRRPHRDGRRRAGGVRHPLPARVGGDEQLARLGVAAVAHLLPPPSQRRHRERRRVVVTSDADPCFIASHVIDAVGNRLAGRVLGKVCGRCSTGSPPRPR